MIAGLSGAVLVGFINLWSPGAWGTRKRSCSLPPSSSAARATIRAPCWGHFGAARIRRDHALFAAVVESGVGAGTRVGGDWLVDHSLPLVPTQWHPPGAATHSQRVIGVIEPVPTGDDSDALINLGKIDQMDFARC